MQEILINNLDEMKDFARSLAKKDLPLLLLVGDLGAGKTTFTKAYARALSIEGVKSPSYSIVEEHPYPGGVFYHMDLYRVEDLEELQALGFEEYFDRATKIVIEWPGIGLELIPSWAQVLEIEILDENKRRLRLGTREDFGL